MSRASPTSDPLPWERVDQALRELLDLEPEERDAYLATLRETDPRLAARVGQLLQGSDHVPELDSAEFLAGVAQTALREVSRHRSGERFGAWELRELIGSGGMADVYLAGRRIDDDVQSAAIKLVHVPGAGWSTESLVREAQVLARLSDPRIARLLDFGRTAAGEPWVAMEFVEGEPIDRWCAGRGATVRERVRLMINVAMAVDHAHRNLVVHRDIKPGNVFVTTRDGGVKLLDFGIARALPTPGVDATRTGLRAYTQAYASPEQLTGESVAVASDVYQLGELLYLLLCESHPFDGLTLNPAALLKAMEAGAMPPSRRAKAGPAPARRLARQGSIDLETIALKAMEFAPARRYLSAREFADDLKAWLDGRAISARRGRLYRTGRLLRRQWGVVATIALATGLLVTYVVNLRDREALLESQRERTERVLEVAIDVLDETDPYLAGASPEAADAAMRRIRARVHQEASADGEFRTRILNLLASVHGRRGQVPVAIELRQEALEIATRERLPPALLAETAYGLARALHSATRNDDALDVLRRHDAILDRHARATTQALLARIEGENGRPDAARTRLETFAATLDPRRSPSYDERALLNQLAIARGMQQDDEGSLAAAERAFDRFEPRTGKEIASWLTYAMNLAVAYGDARRYREADELHRRVSAWVERELGTAHPQFAIVERSRATGMLRVARYSDAFAIVDAASDSASRQQSPLHRSAFLRTRANAALYAGQPELALQGLIEASILGRRELAGAPSERLRAEEALAWALFEAGAYPEAAEVARELPADAVPGLRRAALVRLLLDGMEVGEFEAATLDADRAAIAAHPCLSVELALFEHAIDRRGARPELALPARCDGLEGSIAAALGARWEPDWRDDFPRVPFESDVVRRLRRGDFAARALPDSLLPSWQRRGETPVGTGSR